MNLNEFIEKNDIAIVAIANLQEKSFDIIKRDLELEAYDLFEQLIIHGSVENLMENIEGQILPRIWTQGNTRCIVCRPDPNQIVALFYDNSLNACFVLTLLDCLGIHYEQWSKQEWFAPRMQRWNKENLIPYVQGERIYADDFYLLHVQGLQ